MYWANFLHIENQRIVNVLFLLCLLSLTAARVALGTRDNGLDSQNSSITNKPQSGQGSPTGPHCLSRCPYLRNAFNVSSSGLSFLNLPAELRKEMNRHLLVGRRTKRYFGLGLASYNLHVAILRTTRQIYNEALKIFQANKFIRINTPWTTFKKDVITQGKFLMIAEKKANSCELWHMKVVLGFME